MDRRAAQPMGGFFIAGGRLQIVEKRCKIVLNWIVNGRLQGKSSCGGGGNLYKCLLNNGLVEI
jgi:hypothetical protein